MLVSSHILFRSRGSPASMECRSGRTSRSSFGRARYASDAGMRKRATPALTRFTFADTRLPATTLAASLGTFKRPGRVRHSLDASIPSSAACRRWRRTMIAALLYRQVLPASLMSLVAPTRLRSTSTPVRPPMTVAACPTCRQSLVACNLRR